MSKFINTTLEKIMTHVEKFGSKPAIYHASIPTNIRMRKITIKNAWDLSSVRTMEIRLLANKI